MEKRLLIAFVLMGLVLFLTPYFYKTVVPPRGPVKTAETKPAVESKAPAPIPAPEQQALSAAAATPAAQVSGAQEEIFKLDTTLYRIEFSNRGGVVRNWILKKFKDGEGHPLNLVNPNAVAKTGYPFALAFKDKRPSVDVNTVLYAAKPLPDGLGITYEYSNGKTAVRKTFHFERDSYLSQISTDVTEGGAAIPALISWRGGFGDAAIQNAASQIHTLYFDTKLRTNEAKAAKNGPLLESGSYSFAGLEDNYFAAVFLPKGTSSFELRTVADSVPGVLDKAEAPHVGAEVGGSAQNTFLLFVGPKDLDLLKNIDPRLEQMVDFGWFSIVAKPLFLLLNWTNDHVIHNYGWAIVLVTVLINFALLPMRLSSMKSMKRMQSLQPQIAQINAKYKNVGLRDPRKAEQNAEVMELYKKHGVNPMGGCLPMVIQIPFFIAFYNVLKSAIEMRGANWLWVTDLSRPEALPIHILPIVMIIAQFVQQKMTPNPSGDPNQQRMMMFMPLIFGFMFYSVSSGLVLYWLTSNLVGIAQQWFINKSMPAAPPAPVVATNKKSGSRR